MNPVLKLIVPITFLVVMGCSRQESSQKVTITYQTIETLPQQRAALAELVEAFEDSHPDIRIKVQTSPSGFQKLQAQMAAGTVPDVFYFISDRLPSLVHRGVVMDLAPFMEEDPSLDITAYYAKTIDSCRYGEGLYCFPLHFSTDILFYNRDLFDKAGLPYPNENWTWDEFAKVALLLTDSNEGDNRQYGTLQPRPLLLIKAFGGDAFRQGRSVINGPAGKKGIAFLEALMTSGASPHLSTLRDVEVMDGVSLFSTGRIGMLVGRTYMLAEFSKLTGMDWDVALVPKGERRYSRLAVGGNCISAQTAHPKEAWEFVKFFSGPEGSRILGKFRNAIPALRSAATSEVFLRPPPLNTGVFLTALETSEIENPGMILWQEYIDKVLQPNVDAVLFGKLSPEEALGEMHNQGQVFLSREMDLRAR